MNTAANRRMVDLRVECRWLWCRGHAVNAIAGRLNMPIAFVEHALFARVAV